MGKKLLKKNYYEKITKKKTKGKPQKYPFTVRRGRRPPADRRVLHLLEDNP
jgi:hypothetical protein